MLSLFPPICHPLNLRSLDTFLPSFTCLCFNLWLPVSYLYVSIMLVIFLNLHLSIPTGGVANYGQTMHPNRWHIRVQQKILKHPQVHRGSHWLSRASSKQTPYWTKNFGHCSWVWRPQYWVNNQGEQPSTIRTTIQHAEWLVLTAPLSSFYPQQHLKIRERL